MELSTSTSKEDNTTANTLANVDCSNKPPENRLLLQAITLPLIVGVEQSRRGTNFLESNFPLKCYLRIALSPNRSKETVSSDETHGLVGDRIPKKREERPTPKGQNTRKEHRFPFAVRIGGHHDSPRRGKFQPRRRFPLLHMIFMHAKRTPKEHIPK